MYEASNFSISLSTLVIVGFYFWHARIYDVVSRCAFDLKFPNNDFPGGSDSKTSVYNVGDLSSIPGSGRFSGGGNGNPLQYSCLENPMDRGAWFRLLSMGSQRDGHG